MRTETNVLLERNVPLYAVLGLYTLNTFFFSFLGKVFSFLSWKSLFVRITKRKERDAHRKEVSVFLLFIHVFFFFFFSAL